MSKKTKLSSKALLRYMIARGVATILSFGLIIAGAKVLRADYEGFRSCSTNTGLVVSDCGKQSFSPGDAMLCFLFQLCAILIVCFATMVYRLVKAGMLNNKTKAYLSNCIGTIWLFNVLITDSTFKMANRYLRQHINRQGEEVYE
jgi:hypothetical protein